MNLARILGGFATKGPKRGQTFAKSFSSSPSYGEIFGFVDFKTKFA
jgi:hypothetical protein